MGMPSHSTRRSSPVNVSFAAARPTGAYALAIPVRGDDLLSDRLADLDGNARTLAARSAEAQRFEREPAAIAETFFTDGDSARRLLLVGLGNRADEDALYERVGGALTARLLTSGETRLVIDLSGLALSAAQAARIGFGAAARAWRYDKYRTKLAKKQKPTLEEIVLVGAGGEAYDKQMDSPIADMKNAGPREGGSIMAATFLQRFVEEGVKWAHLDVAGTVWANKAGTLYDKGATGYGVALLDRYIADQHER
jgi:leucyl aminopeptidase